MSEQGRPEDGTDNEGVNMSEGERPVPLRLILPLEIRDDPEKIGAIVVAGESGARIPLRDLATLQVVEAQLRFLAISGELERSVGLTAGSAGSRR